MCSHSADLPIGFLLGFGIALRGQGPIMVCGSHSRLPPRTSNEWEIRSSLNCSLASNMVNFRAGRAEMAGAARCSWTLPPYLLPRASQTSCRARLLSVLMASSRQASDRSRVALGLKAFLPTHSMLTHLKKTRGLPKLRTARARH